MTCLFCDIPKERIIAMNDLAYAIRDGFPVSKLHTLVIPKRHALDYFELTKDELYDMNDPEQVLQAIANILPPKDK